MSLQASLILIPVLLAASCAGATEQSTLRLATTTSVGNSGLLDTLTSAYAAERGLVVRTQLVGSGLALRMLGERHVDIVISHAPATENEALAAHPRWHYRKIMYNDFVLAGPASDPAGVAEATELIDAMRRIAESNAIFLSRGDRSGTHEREEQLWTRAGVRPADSRLVVAGAGMGSTLRTANETGAYTLTDRATFVQLSARLGAMKVLYEGGRELLNTYAVLYDQDGEAATEAAAFSWWLAEGGGREQIERYTVAGGARAFIVWPRDRPGARPGDVPF